MALTSAEATKDIAPGQADGADGGEPGEARTTGETAETRTSLPVRTPRGPEQPDNLPGQFRQNLAQASILPRHRRSPVGSGRSADTDEGYSPQSRKDDIHSFTGR